MPAPGTELAGLMAPEPWRGETGSQCPGRAAASSCPLWAWLVGLELRARCKPCTQRTAWPPSPGTLLPRSCGASRLSSPFLSTPRPFPTPKGSKMARVPSSPPLPLHLSAQLQRQAGEPQEEGTLDLPGTPEAAVAPGNGIQTTGQHVSWDGKPCSSKALALLAGGPGCFWIPCALTLPRSPKSSPTEVQRLMSTSAGPRGRAARTAAAHPHPALKRGGPGQTQSPQLPGLGCPLDGGAQAPVR